MAILTGANLIVADDDNIIYGHQSVAITAQEGKVVLGDDDLAIYADADRPVYIMILDPNGEKAGVGVLANDMVGNDKKTITYDQINAGDLILVDYYAEFKDEAIQIEITPDKFAGYFYIEGSTLYRREVDGVDVPAEIIIPKGKVQTSFTFTMAGTGEPSSFDFTIDAFPGYIKGGSTKTLAALQILGAKNNCSGTEEEDDDTVTYTNSCGFQVAP